MLFRKWRKILHHLLCVVTFDFLQLPNITAFVYCNFISKWILNASKTSLKPSSNCGTDKCETCNYLHHVLFFWHVTFPVLQALRLIVSPVLHAIIDYNVVQSACFVQWIPHCIGAGIKNSITKQWASPPFVHRAFLSATAPITPPSSSHTRGVPYFRGSQPPSITLNWMRELSWPTERMGAAGGAPRESPSLRLLSLLTLRCAPEQKCCVPSVFSSCLYNHLESLTHFHHIGLSLQAKNDLKYVSWLFGHLNIYFCLIHNVSVVNQCVIQLVNDFSWCLRSTNQGISVIGCKHYNL